MVVREIIVKRGLQVNLVHGVIGKLLFSGVFSSVVREIVVQRGLQQGCQGKLLCSGVIMESCCAVGSSWEVVVLWGCHRKLLCSGFVMGNCSSAGVVR